MSPAPRTGVLLVLLAATLWGTTGTAQALAAGTLSSTWFGALRLVAASLFFAVTAALAARRTTAGPRGRPSWAESLGAGVCMAVYNLAFFGGVREVGVAVGTAIALGSGPIWAGLLQAVVTRRPPVARWWAGTLLAVTGGVLLTAGGAQGARELSAAGVALCLASGLSYAAYTLLNKRMAAHASASSITLHAFAFAAVIAVPFSALQSGLPSLGVRDVLAVTYTGVFTAGIAYLLFSRALLHIGSATAVTLALGEPVVAFFLAILVVGERPSTAAFVGLACVVLGVAVVVGEELRAQIRQRALKAA
jgi:DME family drug/metabolite transporter